MKRSLPLKLSSNESKKPAPKEGVIQTRVLSCLRVKNKGKKNNKNPDWMLISPKEGQAMTKMVNNKSYHWCTCHKAWT